MGGLSRFAKGVDVSEGRFRFLSVLFFLSGCAALIYQVAWQRILVLHTGVGTAAVAVIVASFMLGLGLGSHFGALVSRRISPRSGLVLFSFLELLIGLIGAISPWFLYDFLFLQKASWFQDPWVGALLHFSLIAVPTTFMGFSLPVLVRACVDSQGEAAARVSVLYAINTLGAAMGAILSAWLLIRFLGVRNTLFFASSLNLSVAVGSTFLMRKMADVRTKVEKVPAELRAHTLSFRALVFMFGLSGFVSLSFEILWFRVLDVAVKSAAFTFGSLLGLYLLGLFAGSFWGRKLNGGYPLVGFLRAILWSSVASSSFLVFVAYVVPDGLSWYFRFWGRYDGFGNQIHLFPGPLFLLYVLFPALLFGFATFCMGIAFVQIQRLAQNDVENSGYKVGVLQASNILGCTLGSLLTGVGLLNIFGTTGAFRIILLVSTVFAGFGYFLTQERRAFLRLGAIVLFLALVFPSQQRFWARLHGQTDISSVRVEEDSSGVSLLSPEGPDSYRFSANGLGISWLPFRGIHTRLGAVPAALHPSPRRIASVGLGSGDTAWASVWREETQDARVFEIIRSQEVLLRRFVSEGNMPVLRGFLSDPRVKLDFRDGRLALERDRVLYDLIELDALRPSAAFSGNLYSKEFYQLLRNSLAPGGLVCIWAPTLRSRKTFQSVFPYVQSFEGGSILIGSAVSMDGYARLALDRIRSDRARSYFGEALRLEIERTLMSPDPVVPLGNAEVNTDLFPRDEFATPEASSG